MTKRNRTKTPACDTLTAEQFLRIALGYAEDAYHDGCDFSFSGRLAPGCSTGAVAHSERCVVRLSRFTDPRRERHCRNSQVQSFCTAIVIRKVKSQARGP